MVLFIGAEVHKMSHTPVTVDPAGQRVGQLQVMTTPSGHKKAYRGATKCKDQDRPWG